MSKAWAKGSTRAYRIKRQRVLDENTRINHGRCTLQIPRVCTGQADTVHHTEGRAVTGDDPRYMVAACAACNLKIGEPGRDAPPTRRVSRW